MFGLFFTFATLVIVLFNYSNKTDNSDLAKNEALLVQTPSPTPKPPAQETLILKATLKPTAKPTTKISPTPKPTTNNQFYLNKDLILGLINSYRASKGINTLGTSSEICSLVETRADFLFANDLANAKASLSGSHVGFTEQMKIYSGKGYAENLTIGAATNERVLSLWQASPGHNSNLLATQIGSTTMSKGCVATRGSNSSSLAVFLIGDK